MHQLATTPPDSRKSHIMNNARALLNERWSGTLARQLMSCGRHSCHIWEQLVVGQMSVGTQSQRDMVKDAGIVYIVTQGKSRYVTRRSFACCSTRIIIWVMWGHVVKGQSVKLCSFDTIFVQCNRCQLKQMEISPFCTEAMELMLSPDSLCYQIIAKIGTLSKVPSISSEWLF